MRVLMRPLLMLIVLVAAMAGCYQASNTFNSVGPVEPPEKLTVPPKETASIGHQVVAEVEGMT